MANQLPTTQLMSEEGMIILKNNIVVAPALSRAYAPSFGGKKKYGDTIFIDKPIRSTGREGSGFTAEPIIRTNVPVTLNQQIGYDFELSTTEMALNLDALKDKVLKPAMASMANRVDVKCTTAIVQNTANLVGTIGTTPGLSGSDAFLIYAQACAKMGERGFPMTDPSDFLIALSEQAKVGWLSFSKAFFQPDGIGKQWETGQISNAMGVKWKVSENVPTQVGGSYGGTPAVNGVGQTGTSIITNGWTANVATLLQVGDVISYAGVFNVNPQPPHNSDGSLFQQVVQAIGSSDGGGNATIVVYPALTPSGPYQNCTASPANGALISINGVAAAGQAAIAGASSRQQLLIHKSAYAFVNFDADVPSDVNQGYNSYSKEAGLNMRFVQAFDINSDKWPARFDMYFGISPILSEGVTRIQT